MRFQNITVGGTFDRLHSGHKTMLETAFEKGEKIWLGITSDHFAKQIIGKMNNLTKIEIYQKRKHEVEKYLQQKNYLKRAQIISIDDRFGTTLTAQSLEAIVVSPETELVATEINLIRAQKNWHQLEVILVPWVLADDGEPIHSVRIRQGLIDRNGRLFSLSGNWGVRHLPEVYRQKLKKSLGKLISEKSQKDIVQKFVSRANESLLITVGDAVTEGLVRNGVIPDISIIDFLIQRKQVYQKIADLGFREINVIRKAKNIAGTLSFESYSALSSLIHREAKPSILQIDGEEDLLTLFAIFLAPLNSSIVYGQPNEGVVVVDVTEKKKEEIREMLEEFS